MGEIFGETAGGRGRGAILWLRDSHFVKYTDNALFAIQALKLSCPDALESVAEQFAAMKITAQDKVMIQQMKAKMQAAGNQPDEEQQGLVMGIAIDRCAVCGSDSSLSVCGRCKKVAYCSREHQKVHWKQHKTHCNS